MYAEQLFHLNLIYQCQQIDKIKGVPQKLMEKSLLAICLIVGVNKRTATTPVDPSINLFRQIDLSFVCYYQRKIYLEMWKGIIKLTSFFTLKELLDINLKN